MRLPRFVLLLVSCVPITGLKAQSASQDTNILWEENFAHAETASDYKAGWTVTDGTMEAGTDGLSLLPAPQKTLRLQRRLDFDFLAGNPYRYLQIELAEAPANSGFLACANSSRGGSALGLAGDGLTTFDLAGQKAYDAAQKGKWAFTGFYKSKSGTPMVIKSIRNVATPLGGLAIELATDANGDGVAEEGDELLIKYYADPIEKKSQGIAVEPILFPSDRSGEIKVIEIDSKDRLTLKDDGKDGDEKAGDGIYSLKVALKNVSPDFQSHPVANEAKSPEPVFGVRTLEGKPSTGVAPFGFSLGSGATSEAKPVENKEKPAAPSAALARAEWAELTKGEELARGVPVKFFPAPDYNLTTDANDPHDLTDGTLSNRADDRIWFTKEAVGWRIVQDNEIVMLLDLGSVKPVGQIALRVLGGKEQGSLVLPSAIEFLGSDDGQEFHTLQHMAKLLPAEKDLADGQTAFYVPEDGVAFMHAFVCRTAVNTRYVAIRVQPYTGLFVDQISVQAARDEKVAALSSFEKVPFSMDGAMVYPRKTPFVVTRNITTPNWFLLRNYTGNTSPKTEISFEVKVPEAVELLPSGSFQIHQLSCEGGIRNYEVRNLATKAAGKRYAQLQGPFYFKTTGENTDTAKIEISTKIAGVASRESEAPLKVVDIPEVGELPGLDLSLGWISDQEQQEWPGVLTNWKKLGFNFVSSFPRNFSAAGGQAEVEKNLGFLEAARAENFRVIYEESPFHIMEKAVNQAMAAGEVSKEEQKKIYNQINGANGKWINPFYRGKYFQEEIARVARLTKQVRPDHVYLDIEWWHDGVREAKDDPAVRKAWQESGKTWEDFMLNCGTEVLRDLVTAIREASGEHKVMVGLYNSHPGAPPVQDFFEWNRIYPELVDIAMPSLYVQGRAQDVADVVRGNYQKMGARNIIPWLTAGTYGEFDPELMRPMVLEAILNGARGFTTYWFGDFDPMDYFYVSSALAELAKYPTLLKNGAPSPYTAENADLHYTCFKSTDEALVLVGNYSHSKHSSVRLASPLEANGRNITADDQALSAEGYTGLISVPPGTIKLIHFRAS